MARIVLIGIIVMEAVLIVGAFCARKKEELFKFLTFVTSIIATLAATITILFPEELATVIYPDVDTYISENQLLKEQNATLASQIEQIETDYANLQQEYSNSDIAKISDAKLILNGLENTSPLNSCIATINGKEFFDSNVIYSITGIRPSYDSSQHIIYWGEGNEVTRFSFADVSDILYNGQVYWKYKPSENASFTVAGKEYNDGFVIGCDHSLFGDGDGYALFNLGNEYTEMSFDVGKTDDYEIQDVKLKIFLDGEETEQYALSGETTSTHITVSLDNAKNLKILLTDGSRVKYGFFNVVFST